MPLILLHAQVNMTLLPPNFFSNYSMLVRFVLSGRMSCPHLHVQRKIDKMGTTNFLSPNSGTPINCLIFHYNFNVNIFP
uniref:Uncharacterized protein n=1 Tax=Aegilops tauschii subsp. strangulata TaxID=200361 RepID=A0A453HVD3_AEGTS